MEPWCVLPLKRAGHSVAPRRSDGLEFGRSRLSVRRKA